VGLVAVSHGASARRVVNNHALVDPHSFEVVACGPSSILPPSARLRKYVSARARDLD
jgi:hypothetical protein